MSITPQKFTRTVEVEAVQWDGSVQGANDICVWAAHGMAPQLGPPTISYRTHLWESSADASLILRGAFQPVGCWITKDGVGRIGAVASDAEFQSIYTLGIESMA